MSGRSKDWEYDLDWYRPPRRSWPAAIRLEGRSGVVLDREAVSGTNFQGLGVLLVNCRDVRIRRSAIHGFRYAVYAVECQNITIEDNCDFGRNFDRPGTGWIISEVPALQGDRLGWGGGIYFRRVRGGAIRGVDLSHQFDGIDLVECSDISVISNRIAFTSNYGVHLWGSRGCLIQDNDCSRAVRHTPRFARDTADSAAVLIERGSHRNKVIGNDLRWSGDGLFIRDLTNGRAASNENYVARNQCSHAWNNAIEVVFSHGNVLEDNDASFSNYGMWLDFSTDLVVRGNRVEQNAKEGAHIKRGGFREFAGNRVLANPVGVKLIGTDAAPLDPSNIFAQNAVDVQSVAFKE